MFKVGDTVKGNGGKQTRSLKVAAHPERRVSAADRLRRRLRLEGHWPGDLRGHDDRAIRALGRDHLGGDRRELPDAADDERRRHGGATTAAPTSARSRSPAARWRSTARPASEARSARPSGSRARSTRSTSPKAASTRSSPPRTTAIRRRHRPLRSSVWEDVAINFMAIPYDAMRSRVIAAEKLARTPNRCVTIDFPGAPTPPRAGPDDEPDRSASSDRRRRRRHALLHPPVGEQHPRRVDQPPGADGAAARRDERALERQALVLVHRARRRAGPTRSRSASTSR